MRFRNYRNRHNKKNRIYSQEELLEMTLNNLFDNEPLILAQDSDIGIPSIEELRQSPNTRWIDKYTDEYGQQHGGYYGSIGDYDEFIAPKQKFPPIDKDRYKTYPIYMAETEVQEEEDEEESPIVLEGGVEENVYYPDEEQFPQEEDEQQIPAEDGADDGNSRKSPLEINDEAMTRILQDMLQDLTKNKSQNIQDFDTFQDIQDNIIEIPEQRHNTTLPKIGQFEQISELEKLYKKLLEELKKRMRLKNFSNGAFNRGDVTGGAASINRNNEIMNINALIKNNDEFFDKERQKPQSWLMRINAEKNNERPDAKLFMDIALVGPKNVPSTKDYHFISSKQAEEINKKYNLHGNKEIPGHYDGFEFSTNSATAQNLNNSDEFKNQILSSKNFDSKTGTFKHDKLEIEFNNDKNLQYSFGHMTVLNPKIDNGYITGIGYDKYNYEAMYGKKFENVSKETKSLNNKARFLQATSKLKNYYVLVPVKVKI